MIQKTIKTLTLIASSIALAAMAPAAHHGEAHKHADLITVAKAAGIFNTLVAAVSAADLVKTLQGDGPFTVFAPTDEAFAKLPEGTVESLLKPENKDKLTAILKHHVVLGKLMAKNVEEGKVATVNGSSINVTVKGGNVFIDNAKVTKTDVKASNGVVHIIDSVMIPES